MTSTATIMSVMDERMSTLHEDLTALRIDLAVIRANYVTKADLIALEGRLIRYLVFGNVVLAVVVIAAAKFMH
jgi:hypothetical protein